MSIFSKYKRVAYGVSINDRALRFVELRRSKKFGINIQYFKELTLPRGVVVGGEIIKATKLAEIISSLNKKNIRKDIHLIVPEQQSFRTFLKNIKIKEDEKNFSKFINSYVKKERNIDLEKKEFLCEYEKVKSDNMENSFYVSCVPKSLIASYEFIFKNSKFNLKSFETYTENIARIMLKKRKDKAYITIDFGKDETWITILCSGFPIKQIHVPIGGDNLIEPIQNFLSLEKRDAYSIKEKYGVSRKHREEKLLQKLLNELNPIIKTINKQYVYWHTQEYKKPPYNLKINEIILYGEEANLLGLKEHISKSLELPVRQLDLVKDSDHLFQEILNLHRDDWYKYFPAVFAALSEFKK